MAFPIKPKRRSGAVGNPTTLELGELAVNTADGSLYLTLYDMAKWDAALYGEKLLTTPNPADSDDRKLMARLGMRPLDPQA